uniref:serine/threonine protein kinase n=1 Tax=Chamaesiphon sp. OTE_8_metabat_110 TaxID=2964696 RepID=UPI00286D0BF7
MYKGELILNDRYQIINILGQGGIATTYAAKDLETDETVAIKVMSLRRAQDWKAIELFEREAKILAQLNHPAIPQYLDYFQIDTDRDREFYIVQSLAPGTPLSVLIDRGWQPEVAEVEQIAAQVLEILNYLHRLAPPVIHRDIKPQNLIKSPKGKIYLVDFGAVQDTYHQTVTGGSTVVGTYGYMAPEQFRGQAYLSTDLYGLATTLLFLLTREDPSKLPHKQLKINFRSSLQLPRKFADWLDRMLEPTVEQRFTTAAEALAVLRGLQKLPPLVANNRPRKPIDSPIRVVADETNLTITIPAVRFRTTNSQQLALLAIFSNFIIIITVYFITTISFSIEPLK